MKFSHSLTPSSSDRPCSYFGHEDSTIPLFCVLNVLDILLLPGVKCTRLLSFDRKLSLNKYIVGAIITDRDWPFILPGHKRCTIELF